MVHIRHFSGVKLHFQGYIHVLSHLLLLFIIIIIIIIIKYTAYLQEGDLWGGLGVDGRTILEWTLKR